MKSKHASDAQDRLIVPGLRIGRLKLGETRIQALKLFPPTPGQNEGWKGDCGATFNWIDGSNEVGKGNVFIRLRSDKVFQIESATTRFRTSQGVTTYDSPDKVRRAYKNLKAYVLLGPTVSALGDRPPIFWVDNKRGIAFEIAYYPAEDRRYVYKVIVFRAGGDFCPEDNTTHSPNWRELTPYSLEPPGKFADLAFLLAGPS
ncbi:MAG: hypothetical protein M3O09_19290 [Acidobacteriota bacterium]|nr:hypothetical protein [Acidobacteriota bacterium]